MSDSGIEWTDRTWEVTAGCTKVSSGCAHCYAETLVGGRLYGSSLRRKNDGKLGAAVDVSLEVIDPKTRRWNGEVRELPMNLDQPLKRQKPTVYFVNSRSDLFHEAVDFAYIDKVFAVMALCPQHRFLVLTKRPKRMREYLTQREPLPGSFTRKRGCEWKTPCDRVYREVHHSPHASRIVERGLVWPLPNVWLGTSVEDQAVADVRIPELLACPVGEAAGRFLSVEPLLGAVRIDRLRRSTRMHMCMDVRGALQNKSFDGFKHPDGTAMTRQEAEDSLWAIHATGAKVIPMADCDDFDDQKGCRGHKQPGLDWVIVGGESGKDARVCRVEWIRSIVEQCTEASVPVFVKQMGSNAHDLESCDWGAPCAETKVVTGKGNDPYEWPEDLRVRQVPEGLVVGQGSGISHQGSGGEKTRLAEDGQAVAPGEDGGGA